MDIIEFISSLDWPEGEMDKRIAALDAEFGVEAIYGPDMILTDEEYRQYRTIAPDNRTLYEFDIVLG